MKTKEEIYQSMCADFEEQSGLPLAEGSEIAVRLLATAAALESLYYYADWSRQQCFPQTASGGYLDYHGQMRDVARSGAVCATGEITFYVSSARTQATVIPAGTVVSSENLLLFETLAEGSIPAGSMSVTIPAVCQTAGAVGNVASKTVTLLTTAPVGISQCMNLAGFTGGADGEDDESYRQRILRTYQQLSTGANSGYYYNTAMSFEQVASCKVIPRSNGIGTVKVLITGAAGNTETLRSTIEKKLNEEREISTDVTVAYAETATITICAYIWPKNGVTFYEAAAAVRASVDAFMKGIQIGQSVYLTQLGAQMINSGAITTYRFETGSLDLTVNEMQQLRLVLNLAEGT